MNKPEYSHAPISVTAIMLLVMLSFLWGGNMISIKFSSQGIPPILAAMMRSLLASIFLWIHARAMGEDVFLEPAYIKHGIVIGILFGVEFLLLFWGPSFTDASRAVVFLYTQPLWVALAAHFVLPNDRLTWAKSLGLLLAFGGLILVFWSRSPTLGPLYWLGDLMEMAAGLLWAATTIYIKKFIWNRPITHFQTLFAQLFFSIPILGVGVLIFEWGQPIKLTSLVIASVFYQTVIIAYLSYLLWFWMIHRYQVSVLSAFTFLTPLFGVILCGIILGEPLPILLWIGLAFVALGIYLVNQPTPVAEE